MAPPPKPALRHLTVRSKTQLTPNMIRVTLVADWVRDLRPGIEGAHCKLFFAASGQSKEAFLTQLAEGPRATVRTYTIRFIRPKQGEMDIDFVDHGDVGPASTWARACAPGDICGFGGPGPVKITDFTADQYVVAADMSALPVAAATLEAMPRDAKGLAFLEITSPEDAQPIDAPAGVELHWLIHPDPMVPPTQSVQRIRALPPLAGSVQTCIAGESSMITALRNEILVRRAVPRTQSYISGYWKIGLIEDEHQKEKNAAAAAA